MIHMREIVNRLLEEKFEHDQGVLTFSVERVELTLMKGEIREGSFSISIGSYDSQAEGYITATGDGMECLVREFEGNEIVVPYRFDSKGLEEGDVLQGEFVVISNKGEYYLPYVITMEHKVIHSSLGTIKNLFHFANLAKTNWSEAVSVFYSPTFVQIFSGNDREFYPQYLLLSANNMNEQNVEEFINVTNKKQPIDIRVQENRVRIEDPQGYHVHEIEITKKGWGYLQIEASSSEAFLITEKRHIRIEDFYEDTCKFSVYVDTTKLHYGNNDAELSLVTPYKRISIDFRVVVNLEDKTEKNRNTEKKRMVTQLMTFYLAFRQRKISKDTWLSESLPIIDKYNALDETDMSSRLFQAHMMIAEERYTEAKWALDHVEKHLSNGEKNPELWCYYLYLTTLYDRMEEHVNSVTAEIENIYLENEDSWRIAWTLLFLREDLQESNTKKWLFMEEQYGKKCFSPIWYVEAAQLLITAPTLLMKLGDFELQVLWFAIRHEVITKEMMEQVNILVRRNKCYSDRLYEVCKAYYKKTSDEDTLESICMILVKADKLGEEYLEWYRLGIEHDFRITRLYEHFMLSVNLNRPEQLPKMLLMYFAYQSDLDDERNAYLYAHVVRFRSQMPEMYEAYHVAIERFLVDQIHKGHISRDLAYLYHQIITPAMLNKEIALEFIPVLFTNMLQVDRDDIRKVVLINEKTTGEYIFYVEHHVAYVPIYSRDYVIALEDNKGNRYINGIAYDMEKLLLPGKMVKMLDAFEPVHFGYDLYLCENGEHRGRMDSDFLQRYERISASDRITAEYRQEIREYLMQYFFENDMVHELDVYLDELDPESMLLGERNEAIRYMILRGMYEKAYQWIARYGSNSVDPKVLVRLCSRIISRGEMEEDDIMTELTYQVFRKGKYDEFVLRYLVKYFNGLTRQLRNIWKAADSFDIDTRSIVERMLLQMMYTGSFVGEKMDIFRAYVRNGGNEEVEEAFLSFCAYDYFVKEKLEDDFVFEELLRHFHRGSQLNIVSRLAVLKYFGEHPGKRGTSENKDLETMLREVMDLGYYFPFFQNYYKMVPQLGQWQDKTVIEYRTNPNSKVVIHYMLEQNEDKPSEFKKEEMVNMYGGIFQKSFSIFYGETLQYYITEVTDRKEQLTQSGAISRSDMIGETSEGAFHLINDLVIANSMRDYETADQLLREYYLAKYRMKDLFHVI